MSDLRNPADSVEQFRGNARVRPPLHPLEKTLLILVCLHLAFLPWALGTRSAWSQLTSLGLAAVGFIVALWPRVYAGDYALPWLSGRNQPPSPNPEPSPSVPRPSAFRFVPIRRLLRFPPFWIGLALLAYLVVQGLNPSWVWERNENFWWLKRVADVPWLPTSVATPWERFNLWRQFVIWSSAWLTVCTLGIGLTRRRSLEIVLVFLVINGCILGAAGVASRLLAPPWKVLGFIPAPKGTMPFATIVYHNFAGAYFALLVGACTAVAAWLFDAGERSLKKSTPAGLFAVAALFFGGVVLYTASRGASLTVALFAVAFALWFFLRRRLMPAAAGTNRAVTIAVLLLFAGVLGYTARKVDFSQLTGKFDRLIEQQTREESVNSRILANESARRMLADHWVRGVGAGGFQFLFPGYVKAHPEIYQGGKLFWQHAHCDWLELPIELGVAGSALLLTGFGWWLWAFFRPSPDIKSQPSSVRLRPSPLWHSLAVPVALGCGQTLLHAWIDFPFQNPAILVTWLTLLTLSLRWLEIERT